MLRDQVRSSKKTSVKSPPKRSGRQGKAVSRTKQVGRRSKSSAPSSSPAYITFLIIIAVVCLLAASLWYGVSHVFSYLTISSNPQLTLILSEAPTSAEAPEVWLLAESRDAIPRHFRLSTQSELMSGFKESINWQAAQISLATAEAPHTGRVAISQALGMPITKMIYVAEGDSWQSVLSELRRAAVVSMKQGQFEDAAVQSWLVARVSEGTDEMEPVDTIIGRISRMNLSPISSIENCPVAVLNNSGESGFASLVGKVIEQNGGTVLRIANALSVGESAALDSELTSLVIRPDAKEACAQTQGTIESLIFNPQKIEDKTLAEQYRASIVLVLGKDARVEPATEAAQDLHP